MAFHELEICTIPRPAGWFWGGFVVHFNAACFIRRMETLAFTLARWFCSLGRTATRYSEFASRDVSTLSTCSLLEARRQRGVRCGGQEAEALAGLTLFWPENGYWRLYPGFLFPLWPRMLLSLLLTSPLYGSPGLSKSLCV